VINRIAKLAKKKKIRVPYCSRADIRACFAHYSIFNKYETARVSKTERRYIILNAPALDILNGLERFSSHVIMSEIPNEPRSDLKRPWDRIIKHAGLEGLRIHDLRHSFASIGAAGGMGLPIIGKLLGHTQAQTTARYAHPDNEPLKRASEKIAYTIAEALDKGT